MKVAVLFSGGKDSTYSLYLAQEKHEVKYLVTMYPENPHSYMYHLPDPEVTPLLAQALEIELKKGYTRGEKEREVEDLKKVLKGLDVDGVVSGAVRSRYQSSRIDKLCTDLGLEHIKPLWGRKELSLLKEMVSIGFEIVVVSVSAYGMGKEWLGKKVDEQAIMELNELSIKYGINPNGEGGEFETLVLDGSNFTKKLVLVDTEKKWMAECGQLRIKKAKLARHR